jgi:hypothetical protein
LAAPSLEPFLVAWPATISALASVLREPDGRLRVTPWKRPQQNGLPAITYQKIGDESVSSLRGLSGLRTDSYQITCWARTQREARTIAKLVRGRKGGQGLDRYTGTLAGVTIRWACCDDERDQPIPPNDGDDVGVPAVQLDFRIAWDDVDA